MAYRLNQDLKSNKNVLLFNKLPKLRQFHEKNAFYCNPSEVSTSISGLEDETAKGIAQQILVSAVSLNILLA